MFWSFWQKIPIKVYSRENLLNLVWGYGVSGRCAHRGCTYPALREKIEAVPSDPKYVHTKMGNRILFSGIGKTDESKGETDIF